MWYLHFQGGASGSGEPLHEGLDSVMEADAVACGGGEILGTGTLQQNSSHTTLWAF